MKQLGTDYVDLYQPNRINPYIPAEETIGAISRLVEKGFVRRIGMTQMDGETLRHANQVHPPVQGDFISLYTTTFLPFRPLFC